ncbi:DNA protection during starvation protein [bacterium BMS3Abin04]|nr:DNA protection during starvation protein [bacterium BMS3Abin04]
MIKGVLNDFEYLVKEFKKTSDLASITKDNTTVNLADDTIKWLEKAVWMLNATQK